MFIIILIFDVEVNSIENLTKPDSQGTPLLIGFSHPHRQQHLTVTGLEPNTNYTVSIRAVSTHSAVGELRSDSITQVITTNVSGECVKNNQL